MIYLLMKLNLCSLCPETQNLKMSFIRVSDKSETVEMFQSVSQSDHKSVCEWRTVLTVVFTVVFTTLNMDHKEQKKKNRISITVWCASDIS